ncbi:CBS domain-containing protein [Sphingomonas quercus]|uniref:CBS domain-containing protein n=1 Tax=Sphingomonas quercus TaxID=2842451 RepID=A0ABS6BEX2_9SPHN|nr:CBS domain-containing protein [Sphingomonas quercus]MBU3076846.1 CBS domain-containing protein [Sphingomonas quercus]
MTIATILEGKGNAVVSVAAETSVAGVVRILAEKRIGAVPVVEQGNVVGIFSERDVVYGLAQDGAAMLERPVREVMTSPAVTVDRKVRIITALAMMTRRRIRHLPVVEDGALIGFVSIGDLVKRRIDSIEGEAEAMLTYIQQV